MQYTDVPSYQDTSSDKTWVPTKLAEIAVGLKVLFYCCPQSAGKYRQQGRNYVVEDGDIIFFKFNAGAGLTAKKK